MSQQCILAIIIHFFLRVLRLFYSCFFRIVFLFRFYHLMFLWAHDRCFNSIKKQWWRLWNCEYLRLWCDSVVASFFFDSPLLMLPVWCSSSVFHIAAFCSIEIFVVTVATFFVTIDIFLLPIKILDVCKQNGIFFGWSLECLYLSSIVHIFSMFHRWLLTF